MVHYDDIGAALSGTGLALRGGFSVPPDDSASPTRAIVLIGNHGPALWSAFESGRRAEPNPLDAWTKRVIDPIATRFGARAALPGMIRGGLASQARLDSFVAMPRQR